MNQALLTFRPADLVVSRQQRYQTDGFQRDPELGCFYTEGTHGTPLLTIDDLFFVLATTGVENLGRGTLPSQALLVCSRHGVGWMATAGENVVVAGF